MRSVISIKLQSNFIEITLRHGCSPVNLLHIFRTPFARNISEWLFLAKKMLDQLEEVDLLASSLIQLIIFLGLFKRLTSASGTFLLIAFQVFLRYVFVRYGLFFTVS